MNWTRDLNKWIPFMTGLLDARGVVMGGREGVDVSRKVSSGRMIVWHGVMSLESGET